MSNDHMPVLTDSLCDFQDYAGVKGLALSCMMDMRKISNYYKPHPQAKFKQHGWDSDGPSKYVPMRVADSDDAYKAIENFVLPSEWRREVNQASRYLVGAFEKITSPTTVYDLEHGRMDNRKLGKVVEAVAMDTYDAAKILPFKKTIPSPSKVPTIAILADANFGHMWRDPEFIPRMLQLSTAILWACESVGLQCYATLCHNNTGLTRDKAMPYKEAMWAVNFATPTRTIPLKRYACMLHRDMYRWTLISAEAADKKVWDKFTYLEGYESSCGMTWSSGDGGYAVKWAHEVLKADATIAIGNILDADKAEVRLGYDFTVTQAIQEVAKQASKLKGE